MHIHVQTSNDPAAAIPDPWAVVPMPVLASTFVYVETLSNVDPDSGFADLLNILADRFPVVRRLASVETFEAVARQFIFSEPPASNRVHYGDTIPKFIRKVGCSPSIEYLADIAELEMARGTAYRARSVPPLALSAFATLSRRRLDTVKVDLHPSISLIASRFPIVTIWEANQADNDNTIMQWSAEA